MSTDADTRSAPRFGLHAILALFGAAAEPHVSPAPARPGFHYEITPVGDNFTIGERDVVEDFNQRMNRCIGHLLDGNADYFKDKPIAKLLPDRLEKHVGSGTWLATYSSTGETRSFPLTDNDPIAGLRSFLRIMEDHLLEYVRSHPVHNAHAPRAIAALDRT